MNPVDSGRSRVFRSAAEGEEKKPPAPRDRYFDALRAAALVRVVAYHMFPLPWLAMIFPSMGVMFALGGSLMATSMRRSTEQAITGRLRRLLPSLWVMGALLIPVMLWQGWDDRPEWPAFLLWLLPLVEPPSSPWAEPMTGVFWYLVAYLWLVLLSPLLARCYQRARVLTIAAPVLLLAGWDSAPLLVSEALGSAVTDVLTFTGCWVLGFAHRHGDLRRIARKILLPLAAVLVSGGLAWAITHPGEDGVDLAAEPLAYAVYSAGFVLLLLRVTPAMHWLTRRKFLNGFVNLCNARAVTIYLWHNVAITLCFTVGAAIGVEWVGARFEMTAFLGVAVVLLAGFIAVLGWVEDLAARRPVSLLPWSVVPPSRPRVVQQWAGPIWF
jgi:peptidoglycan/LPS O-acetylase OafA/YrhL